jgi:hypothetical protein
MVGRASSDGPKLPVLTSRLFLIRILTSMPELLMLNSGLKLLAVLTTAPQMFVIFAPSDQLRPGIATRWVSYIVPASIFITTGCSPMRCLHFNITFTANVTGDVDFAGQTITNVAYVTATIPLSILTTRFLPLSALLRLAMARTPCRAAASTWGWLARAARSVPR